MLHSCVLIRHQIRSRESAPVGEPRSGVRRPARGGRKPIPWVGVARLPLMGLAPYSLATPSQGVGELPVTPSQGIGLRLPQAGLLTPDLGRHTAADFHTVFIMARPSWQLPRKRLLFSAFFLHGKVGSLSSGETYPRTDYWANLW